ncbi:MAG: MarR family transcriptional regulator [Pseudomonadota bacterium]
MSETKNLHAVLDRLARVVASEDWSGDLNPAQVAALGYLARANRFSRKPSIVADYLGATRGTVSQTLKALVRKGLLVEISDPEDRRSISYAVTPEGHGVLERRNVLDKAVAGMETSEVNALDAGLRGLLVRVLAAQGQKTFGICKTCAHHEDTEEGCRCKLLNVALDKADAEQVCAEHEPSVPS